MLEYTMVYILLQQESVLRTFGLQLQGFIDDLYQKFGILASAGVCRWR